MKLHEEPPVEPKVRGRAKRPNCVIYSRFSPQRRANESDSIETQEAYCQQYAHKKKYTVIAKYQDRAVSGGEEVRPVLWEAISKLKRGDVFVVMKLDRIARNVYLAECCRRAIANRGARIEAVQGDIEGNGPEQQMVRQVLAAAAEYERKQISARTRMSMLYHQRNGRAMGAKVMYGYTCVDKRMVPDPREQEVIRVVRSLVAQKLSAHSIVKVLNENYPDHCRGKRWIWRTVNKICKRIKEEDGYSLVKEPE